MSVRWTSRKVHSKKYKVGVFSKSCINVIYVTFYIRASKAGPEFALPRILPVKTTGVEPLGSAIPGQTNVVQLRKDFPLSRLQFINILQELNDNRLRFFF